MAAVMCQSIYRGRCWSSTCGDFWEVFFRFGLEHVPIRLVIIECKCLCVCFGFKVEYRDDWEVV